MLVDAVDASAHASAQYGLTVDELYASHKDALLRYAASLTRDPAQADDLLQDTFLQAMAHLELLSRLQPHQRKAWLYQVLKNRFLDQLRAYRRQEVLFERLAQQALTDDTLACGAGAFFSAASLNSATPPSAAALPYELFELAPFRYRDLLRKRYILCMSSEEIARELGVPSATVRSRLRLAIAWLREHRSEFM